MIGELSESLEVVRAGVAASMALAGMPAINGRGISIGVGSFDGESAFAVGFQIQGEMASFKVASPAVVVRPVPRQAWASSSNAELKVPKNSRRSEELGRGFYLCARQGAQRRDWRCSSTRGGGWMTGR